jgi:NTE family protein
LLWTLYLVQQQAENSRKRILLGMNNLGQRKVAYWSIDTPIASYGLADALPVTSETTAAVANMRTRLNPFSGTEIELLLKAGYAGADASMRARGLAKSAPVADFMRLPQTG